ncbi:MAG: glycosyltransferase [Flavobacteriales bacterium]|nr:glycosyltransferase [Flavobacteriales bacterium]
MMVQVDILLPFRDAERTLEQSIESMVRQTFSGWKLLLINNGSSDGGPTIAEHWAARDARINVIHEPIIGIAHALNTGLKGGVAPFIARMDADDIAHPERLAKQLAYLQAHPEIGVLGTRTRFETSVEKSSGMAWFVSWQNAILTAHDHYVKRFVDAPLAHPTVMFRRRLIEAHGAYNTGPLPEDHELWLRWMDAGVRFAKLPEELLTWTDHKDRLSRTHSNYRVEAFFTTKAKWLAQWLTQELDGRKVIIAGTSGLCQARVALLEAEGVRVDAFTDVQRREVQDYAFIPPNDLPAPGEAVIISFISQRGTGDRIADFLASRGLVEGEDFILAA